jgi:predicted small metal-binding protein
MGYKDYGAMSKANWDRVIEEIGDKIKRHIEKEYQKTLLHNDRKEKEKQER